MTESTKKWARVLDGIVVETIDLPETLNANNLFNPEIGPWFEASASVEQKWTYTNGVFSAPATSAPIEGVGLLAEPQVIDNANGPLDPEEAATWVP